MDAQLQVPWLSHLSLSCVRRTPRPWNTFSILMSAVCVEKKQAALASFASLFDSFVKFLEEDHDAGAPEDSESLWSTSEAPAISGDNGDVRLTETDGRLLDRGPDEKMLLIHSADLFKTLHAL